MWIFFTYCVLIHRHGYYLSLENVDHEQSNFGAKLKNLDKGKKQLKQSFC